MAKKGRPKLKLNNRKKSEKELTRLDLLAINLDKDSRRFAEQFVIIRNKFESYDQIDVAREALVQSGVTDKKNGSLTNLAEKCLRDPSIISYIQELDPFALMNNTKGSLSSVLVQDIILEALSRGMPRREALKLASVDEKVFDSWLTRGENGEGRAFSIFYRRVLQAEAQFHNESLGVIFDAATKIRTKLKTKTVYGIAPVNKGEEIIVNGKKQRTREVMLSKEVIEETLPPDWSAAAWLLERKYEEWNNKSKDDGVDPRDVAKRIRMALVEIDDLVPLSDKGDNDRGGRGLEDDPVIDIPVTKKQQKLPLETDLRG